MKENFAAIAQQFEMEWHISSEKKLKNMAVFVSKEDHCLTDILWRWRAREFYVNIPLVISNHPHLEELVTGYGIPYYCLPVTPENKQEVEQETLRLLQEKGIDFIALARYMQILSPQFVNQYPNRIINIHHSFLPAFVGAKPYQRAFERGVKLIGATAHYVTDQLDQGPIIEQDILRVNHRYTTEQLKVVGRHVERLAFAKAIGWHIEDKVIVHHNKTVVFS
jgi:formyltetrahydrofolate deformylase